MKTNNWQALVEGKISVAVQDQGIMAAAQLLDFLTNTQANAGDSCPAILKTAVGELSTAIRDWGITEFRE